MFSTVKNAENHFYDAFSNCDLEKMMSVWLDSNEISCIHPGSSALVGTSQITLSWQQIFNPRSKRVFNLETINQISAKDFCLRLVQENIYLEETNFAVPPIYATNIYRKIDCSWFMISHHASESPIGLAADFFSHPKGIVNQSGDLH